ncbi:MAG: MoxR family ATPase [Phormidesmis sp.]
MVKSLNSDERFEYTGTKQPSSKDDYQGKLIYPYLPSSKLVDVVNLAIYLERPLLLKGEPGCGKTQLAIAVAYELGLDFEAWYVKSTSRAKEGLYTYDTVGRLRDAQLAASGALTLEEKNRFEDPATYVRLGPLGRAFMNSKRTVVLIDEIDKADIDFPNDLLLELDEQRIKIAEIQESGKEKEIKAVHPPIVFITSNDEKDLSDAFLRRCLFYYVPFPKPDQMAQIVKNRFPDIADELIDKAIFRFMELRKSLAGEAGRLGKNVSTSELLDWIKALNRESLKDVVNKLSEDTQLPYLEVLLKSWDAHMSYLRLGQDRE